MTATGIACLTGVALWKRARIRRILDVPDTIPHVRSAKAAIQAARDRKGAIAVWATRVPSKLVEMAKAAQIPIWWIEDGFIRSAGLGAAMTLPSSLTLDRQRPYYDPSGPSDLEDLLQNHVFSPEFLERAERLRHTIQARRISKYNLGGAALDLPRGKRLVLVPGQVVDDQSVIKGGAGIASMHQLLERARKAEPDAHIIYKPHPDVVAGLRKGHMDAPSLAGLADQVVVDANIIDLLDQVDAVHTLTSLTGFEALLRGREVHVHGQPFYAGWGLTIDTAPLARRTRRLTLNELVAGALILYPRYGDPVTGHPCSVEALLDRLAETPASPGLRQRIATSALRVMRRWG